MTATVQIDETGAIKLPEDLRKQVGFEPGRPLLAEFRDGGLLIRAAQDSTNSCAGSSILRFFEKACSNLSQEETDRLPVDGAEQHDHYIYGTPKRAR